jgi:uncharacterized membrane protein (DUF4010 family)
MPDADALRTLLTPRAALLLLGLSFLLGLAVEDVYERLGRDRPGGVRTFPLLALSGAVLYALEPRHALAFVAGLGVLGAWLYAYYRVQVERGARRGPADDGAAAPADAPVELGIMVPVTNLVAYLLGPVTLLAPSWASIGLAVTAVLLLGARSTLHDLARRVPLAELTTLGKFLIVAGIVLPLLPNVPVVPWTPITPHQAWLAVVAVATLSYASYLVQRLFPSASVLHASALGGLYSSTATTVVLARRIRESRGRSSSAETGIVLATALMYLRVVVVIAIFDAALALAAAPWLCGLALFALALAASVAVLGRTTGRAHAAALAPPANPLELSTACVFALLFVAVSLASVWVQDRYGRAGVYTLAAVVGVTDIDPFVLSLAQGGLHGASTRMLVTALLVAASSNDLLKAAYAAGFAGWRAASRAAGALLLVALAGFAAAAIVAWG